MLFILQSTSSKLEFLATSSATISISNVVVLDWYVIVIVFFPTVLLSNPEN